MREIAVWETVNEVLLQHLGETAYNHLRDRLFSNLESEGRCKAIRKDRHPDDDRLFVLTLYSFDDDRRHEFEFHVDDTTADTHLLIVEVVHQDDIVG